MQFARATAVFQVTYPRQKKKKTQSASRRDKLGLPTSDMHSQILAKQGLIQFIYV